MGPSGGEPNVMGIGTLLESLAEYRALMMKLQSTPEKMPPFLRYELDRHPKDNVKTVE